MGSLAEFGLFTALGLAIGLVLARLAARGRRIRLEAALRDAEADMDRLGYIVAALRAHPFSQDNATVHAALNWAEWMRARAKTDRDHAAVMLGKFRGEVRG